MRQQLFIDLNDRWSRRVIPKDADPLKLIAELLAEVKELAKTCFKPVRVKPERQQFLFEPYGADSFTVVGLENAAYAARKKLKSFQVLMSTTRGIYTGMLGEQLFTVTKLDAFGNKPKTPAKKTAEEADAIFRSYPLGTLVTASSSHYVVSPPKKETQEKPLKQSKKR